MTVIEADSTNMTLSGLIPNTQYNVSICAATSVGCGPFSRVVNSTDEDSMYTHTENPHRI